MFSDYGLVLVRQGGFAIRADGHEHYADSTTAYFQQPTVVHEITHPREGGDECTVLTVSEDAIVELTGDGVLPTELIPTTPAIDLLNVGLIARLRQGVPVDELDEPLAELVGQVIERGAPGRLTTAQHQLEHHQFRIVDRIREAVAAEPASASFTAIARDLGYSRFHVSRVFRRLTGMTMTAYRRRVRIAAAMDRLAGGEADLAALAVDLGFADQSHMTRALRSAVGKPPGRLREQLTNADVALRAVASLTRAMP